MTTDRMPNTRMVTDTCVDCDGPIDLIDGEWVDDTGIGCAGRGEIGEVVAHRPRMIETAPDTFKMRSR